MLKQGVYLTSSSSKDAFWEYEKKGKMDDQQALAPRATSNSSSASTHMGHICAGSPLGKTHGMDR